mgnify:CR=1 FL=1
MIECLHSVHPSDGGTKGLIPRPAVSGTVEQESRALLWGIIPFIIQSFDIFFLVSILIVSDRIYEVIENRKFLIRSKKLCFTR